MNMRFILIACRVLLGVVFIIASAHKILFPGDFAEAVFQYRILPDALINVTAITLPWIELVVALAIMFSARFKDGAALVILLMLAAFAAAMSFNLLRGLEIACGCFSVGDDVELIGWGTVLRNIGYMFLASAVLAEDWILQRVGKDGGWRF